MVVAAFGEVSSAVDKVIHVYTCGLQSANLSQETGKPVASKISSLGSITATSQCFLCNNFERIYSSSYPPYSIYLKPHTHTHQHHIGIGDDSDDLVL